MTDYISYFYQFNFSLQAVKIVKQSCSVEPLLPLMETFRQMVNDCIRIGLENNASTLKRLSKLCYPALSNYDILSYYKLHAISKAAGILTNRNQSLKRGRRTKIPYFKKGILVSCYGFKIKDDILKVPLGERQHFDVPLNNHTRQVLSDQSLTVRSFTLTANNTVSICYSRDVPEVDCKSITDVDRNLGNLTIGNTQQVKQYDLSKAVDIADNTRSIVSSFKRNDVRIRRMIGRKYGQRRKNRVNQLLHHVSKQIVAEAKKEKTAITFEHLTYIRSGLVETITHNKRRFVTLCIL